MVPKYNIGGNCNARHFAHDYSKNKTKQNKTKQNKTKNKKKQKKRGKGRGGDGASRSTLLALLA